MPTPTKGPRLGGSPSHERIILANLVSQLFEHGRVTTTETKAKRMRPLAEKLITKAKRGDLHARRLAAQTIRDKGVLHQLFAEIAPAMEGRDGGYVRITKIGNRKGDNAPMAVIEIITETVEQSRAAKGKAAKAAAAKAASKAEPKVKATEPTNAEPAAAPEVATLADVATDNAVVETADETASVDTVDAEAAGGDKPEYPNSYRGSEPGEDFVVKGNEDSMLYHTPDSPYYDATVAEVWFKTAEDAEAAGFKPTKAEAKDAT